MKVRIGGEVPATGGSPRSEKALDQVELCMCSGRGLPLLKKAVGPGEMGVWDKVN